MKPTFSPNFSVSSFGALASWRGLPAIAALSWICALAPSPASADDVAAANQLLSNFSAGCTSQGEWTHSALGYANALIATLTQLATDPDCRTINGALSQVQNITVQLQALSQDENQKKLSGLKKQEEQLLLQIGQTHDGSGLTTLLNSLQNTEAQIADLEGQSVENHHYDGTRRQGRELQTLVTGTNILLQQAVQNQSCLEKNPSLLSGFAALAGSVGAVATTGASSLIVAAGTDLFNGLIQSERVHRLERRINRMASSITATAYNCVLETLANQWCTSQDALSIVHLEGEAMAHPSVSSPLNDAIRLLNKDLGKFLGWLDTVRSGTEPANAATAGRQAEALDRDRLVRSARAVAYGIIAEAKVLFDTQTTDADRWAIELQTITAISSFFTQSQQGGRINSGPPTPMEDVMGGPEASLNGPWFLIGITSDKIPYDQQHTRKRQLSSYSWAELPSAISQPTFKPDLTVVKNNVTTWIRLARQRVNAELAVVLNLDPLQLIMNATTPNLRGDSPYKSLQKILLFLRAQDPGFAAVGSFRRLYDDTISRLADVSTQIEHIANSTVANVTEDPATTLTDIYTSAKLDNGVGFLGDRLRWALQLSINRVVTGGHSGLSNSQAAMLLATNDIVSELQSYSGSEDLQPISRDIENSQVITERTLSTFIDEFGGGISQTLKDYDRQARDMNEGPDGTSHKAAAELCLKLLAVPVWPRQISRDLCRDRGLPSLFEGGPSSMIVNDATWAMPFQKRVCAFRDYNRANSLFQHALSSSNL